MLRSSEFDSASKFERPPYHEIEVHIVSPQVLQRGVDAFCDAMVPGVVELGGQPDFLAWNAAIFDPLTDFLLISIC